MKIASDDVATFSSLDGRHAALASLLLSHPVNKTDELIFSPFLSSTNRHNPKL